MSNPVRIFLVEDDPDFIQLIASVSESFNMTLETASSIQEARQKLETSAFDGYILDLNLPDGSGFDLVEDIRQKGDFPIAIITGVYKDEKNFRRLKEKNKIEYVLYKPITREKLKHLLLQLCTTESDSTDSSDKWEELLEKYRKTIYNKIDAITHKVESVKSHPDIITAQALRDEVHKIGGSAGSYGYPTVSEICKKLEKKIDTLLIENKPLNKSFLSDLDTFLSDLKFYFQVTVDPEISLSHTEKKHEESIRRLAYVVDEYEPFLNLLHKEKEIFDLELMTESNPDKAMTAFLSKDFNPKVVLFAESFTDSIQNAFDMIEKVRNMEGRLPTDFGILLKEDSLEKRVKASKRGIKFVFKAPAPALTVLEKLSISVKTDYLKEMRVLVLDDDEEVCAHITNTLNDVGIEVKTIHKPEKLLDALNSFLPHVLLLDVLLPTYDGITLLKVLRSDPVWQNLIILLITHFKNSSVEDLSFSSHADGIFFKPLERDLMQKRILEHAEFLMLTRKFSPEKFRIGLDSLEDLHKRLRNTLLSQTQKVHFALFEVDHFSDYIREHGDEMANNFLVSIGNLLLENSLGKITPYHLEKSRFSIILDNVFGQAAHKILEKILANVISAFTYNIQISCSLIKVDHSFTNTYQILEKAEQCLHDASVKDSVSPVKIVVADHEGGHGKKKRVVLLDPDTHMLKMVKAALESHNLEVITFTNAEDALVEIFSTKDESPPSLIISERKIPDMDGLVFFEKIRSRFLLPPLFYFLTVYSSDEDIRKGLEIGVAEYMTKPFNLSLLTQKVLADIYT